MYALARITTLPPESSFKGKEVWQTLHAWPPSAGAPVRIMGGPVEKAQRAIGIAPKPSAGSIRTIRMRINSFMTLSGKDTPGALMLIPHGQQGAHTLCNSLLEASRYARRYARFYK